MSPKKKIVSPKRPIDHRRPLTSATARGQASSSANARLREDGGFSGAALKCFRSLFAPVASSIYFLTAFLILSLLSNLASIWIRRLNPIGSVTPNSKTRWVRTQLLQVFWGSCNLPLFLWRIMTRNNLGSFSLS